MIDHFGATEEQRIELYKLAIAHSDITEALFTTRLFIKNVKSMQDEGYIALQDSIVAAYARPFTRNKPYGSLEERWSKFEAREHQDIHDLLIKTRHKLVAHSDRDYRNVQIVPPGHTPSEHIEPSKGLAFTVSTSKFPLDTFSKIESVCLDIGGRINDEVFARLYEYYGKMDLPSQPFDLL